MTDWYEPKFQTQRTGSRCWGSNCWAAGGAWLLDAATGGTADVTPEQFREMAGGGSGRPNATTGCRSGFEVDIVAGLRQYGVSSRIIRPTAKVASHLLSTDRRAVFAVAVDYSAWPVELDCQGGEAGPDVNHLVGVIPGAGEPGKVQTMNPLCTPAQGYQRVPVGAIIKAARQFSAEHSRSGIWMVRVLRPMPPDTSEADARIAELEAENDDLTADLAEAKSHGAAIVAL